MKTKKKKKILVSLDGSDRSLNTIRYLARMDPFANMDIILFNVLNTAPESYWDLEKEPCGTKTIPEARAWEAELKKDIDLHMKMALQLLVKMDVPSESIKIKIQKRKKGIARDIVDEAHHGYDFLVARRRGMTGLQRLVLGSVANKLVEKIWFMPLILVGKKPPGNKLMIAFDGSEGAWQSVKLVGSTIGGLDYEVKLVHVIRGNGKMVPELRHIRASASYSKYTEKGMTLALAAAANKLVDLGLRSDRVSTRIIKGARSRAEAITKEAKQEDFGTIVMGRKGVSSVRDFIMGRVTSKVIHMARDRTIWIVR